MAEIIEAISESEMVGISSDTYLYPDNHPANADAKTSLEAKMEENTDEFTGELDFEEQMIERLLAGECSIEYALLVASGLDNDEEVEKYQRKIGKIQSDFDAWYTNSNACHTERFGEERRDDIHIAKALFDYLWERKPERYRYGYTGYRLTCVIDHQLDKEQYLMLGDCVGLTALYTVLGTRLELDLSVLCSEYHILSCLTTSEEEAVKKTAIENTRRNGFDAHFTEKESTEKESIYYFDDFESHDTYAYREESLLNLVACIFNNRGTLNIDAKLFDRAFNELKKAIRLSPNHATAFNNRGCANNGVYNYNGAIADCNEAIRLNSKFAEAFVTRGCAKTRLGRMEEAIADFDDAIRLEPDCAVFYGQRGEAKLFFGDNEGSIVDFKTYNRLIKKMF